MWFCLTTTSKSKDGDFRSRGNARIQGAPDNREESPKSRSGRRRSDRHNGSDYRKTPRTAIAAVPGRMTVVGRGLPSASRTAGGAEPRASSVCDRPRRVIRRGRHLDIYATASHPTTAIWLPMTYIVRRRVHDSIVHLPAPGKRSNGYRAELLRVAG